MIAPTPCPDCGAKRIAKESASYYMEWLECPKCGQRDKARPISVDERV